MQKKKGFFNHLGKPSRKNKFLKKIKEPKGSFLDYSIPVSINCCFFSLVNLFILYSRFIAETLSFIFWLHTRATGRLDLVYLAQILELLWSKILFSKLLVIPV